MKIMKNIAIAALMANVISVKQANADIITYDLIDTPHKKYLEAGFYEYIGGDELFQSYSLEKNGADAQLRYDTAASTVEISGTGYNIDTGGFADFKLLYDNVHLSEGTLTLGDMDNVGTFGGAAVRGKGFTLKILEESFTASGWLTDEAGSHYGDFHLAGNKITTNGASSGQVPAPAPLFLIGAMIIFGAWRRKRSLVD